jgi:hypothetical protein
MIRLRRAALIGQVWLTAVMVLAAGLPQTVCACPPRQTPPAGAGSASRTETRQCPCGGQCCAMTSTGPHEPTCCGQAGPRPARAQAGKHATAREAACQRTLLQPQVYTASDGKHTPSDEAPVAPCIGLPVGVTPSLSPAGAESRAWQGHAPAPPADLVTLLQHFTL